MELKHAYETIGLPETATMEELENRYFMWVRKNKARSSRHDGDGAEEFDFNEIQEAYRTIKAHLQKLADENDPLVQREKARSPFAVKAEYFWHYYRWHTIGAILLLIAIVYSVQSYVHYQERKAAEAKLPPIDVEMTFFGTYLAADQNPDFTSFDKSLLKVMPDWKRVKTNFVYAPLEAKNEFDMAMQQKSVLALATEHPDVYVSDPDNFRRLAQQGVFLPLDKYESELKAAVGEDRLIYAEVLDMNGNSKGKHLYGVDLSDSPAFQNAPFAGAVPKLMGIRLDAKRMDHALALLRTMAEQETS